MKSIIDEISKLIWRVPKMDMLTVQEIIKLMNTEKCAKDMLRTLKENESNLPYTIRDEIIKVALQVVAANR